MYIVWHASDSTFGSAITIDGWHRERGWARIGYGAVILNGYLTSQDRKERRYAAHLDGLLETGRPLDQDSELEADEMQAHAYGLNRESISICLIGSGGDYTLNQICTALRQTQRWMRQFGVRPQNVIGHYEIGRVKPNFATSKTCPDIDMDQIREIIGRFSK